jgi:hypothetical protein
MEGMPDELRNDPDLNRYKTAEDAAKAIKEIRAWGRGRIPVPAADDEAGWRELGEKLRPAAASDYDIPVPEGQDGALADRFRQFAHDTGMPPRWAKATAEFHNRNMSDVVSAEAAKGIEAVKAIEIELGPEAYARRIEATSQMLRGVGIDIPDFAVALQRISGAGPALRGLFALSERTGELDKVDPGNISMRLGTMTPQQAKSAREQAMGDPAWMAKAKVAGTPEANKWRDWARVEAGG